MKKLVARGVDRSEAWQRVRESVDQQAASNFNALAQVNAAGVLVEAAVVRVCR